LRSHVLFLVAASLWPSFAHPRVCPFTSDFALVQFVVGSRGVPVATSLTLLVQPVGLVADSVASAVQRWRDKPAVANGCHVPQLVQRALRWN
jgi:hypothetical protein